MSCVMVCASAPRAAWSVVCQPSADLTRKRMFARSVLRYPISRYPEPDFPTFRLFRTVFWTHGAVSHGTRIRGHQNANARKFAYSTRVLSTVFLVLPLRLQRFHAVSTYCALSPPHVRSVVCMSRCRYTLFSLAIPLRKTVGLRFWF